MCGAGMKKFMERAEHAAFRNRLRQEGMGFILSVNPTFRFASRGATNMSSATLTLRAAIEEELPD